MGSGATNGAGIVWLTTKVCTDAVRASGTGSSFGPAAADAVRVDRRRRVDRAAVDAAAAEQPEHLVGAAHEHRALGRHAHRDRLAGRRRAGRGAAAPRRSDVGWPVAEARRATAAAPGTGPFDVDRRCRWCGRRRSRRWRPCPAASSAPMRAEQRGRRAGVADRRVHRSPTRARRRRAAWRRSRRAGRRGRGATTSSTSSDASCSPTSLHDRQEHLLAEQARVVEVAGRRPRRRRGSGRGTGCVRVTRAQRRVAALGDEHDGRRARAGALLERRCPARGRARRRRRRARPVRCRRRPRRPRASSASMPACGDPENRAPPECGRQAERGGEDGVARPLGERLGGWCPTTGRRRCRSRARRPRARGTRLPHASVSDVLVGGAHRRPGPARRHGPTPRRRQRPPAAARARPRPQPGPEPGKSRPNLRPSLLMRAPRRPSRTPTARTP